MMHETGYDFCEVCKLELVRYLNSGDYTTKPNKLYVADPDITAEHNKYSTLGYDYEKVQINESNIEKANECDSLKFRAIVQNFTKEYQNIKLLFEIRGSDNSLKKSCEKSFVIQPLGNWHNPDAARESCSVEISWGDLPQLERGDNFSGLVIDTSTGEILETEKTNALEWGKVNIRYQLVANGDRSTAVQPPNTGVAEFWMPTDTIYKLNAPQQVGGYAYAGNSLNVGEWYAEAVTIVNRMLGRTCNFWAYFQIMEATNSILRGYDERAIYQDTF